MARAATRRRPTVEDLNDRQRRFYERLPEELREEWLNDLPLISVSTAGNRKKANLIRHRVTLLDNVLSQLQDHRRELVTLAKSLDQGNSSAASVDLRRVLKPPSIEGVSMRYVRSAKDEG
jgi:hypothetical protein